MITYRKILYSLLEVHEYSTRGVLNSIELFPRTPANYLVLYINVQHNRNIRKKIELLGFDRTTGFPSTCSNRIQLLTRIRSRYPRRL